MLKFSNFPIFKKLKNIFFNMFNRKIYCSLQIINYQLIDLRLFNINDYDEWLVAFVKILVDINSNFQK